MARRGARNLDDEHAGPASQEWRGAVRRARGDDWEPEIWVPDVELEPEAEADGPSAPRPSGRARQGPRPEVPVGGTTAKDRVDARRRQRQVPPEVASELEEATGPHKADRLAERLADASRAYERERYEDARRMVRPLIDQAPSSAAVRELLGLVEYRRGRWREAIKQLEAFRSLSGSVEQHPVLADAYRAIRRHRQVDELWEELRAASPSAALMAEGRIVVAGSLADRGDLTGAIQLLERGGTERKRAKDHHFRQWYALADLYERAGDIPRARDLFGRLTDMDPDAFDVADRLRSLR